METWDYEGERSESSVVPYHFLLRRVRSKSEPLLAKTWGKTAESSLRSDSVNRLASRSRRRRSRSSADACTALCSVHIYWTITQMSAMYWTPS